MIKTLIAFLLVPFLTVATFEWVKVKIDDRVSITFPSQPETKDLNGLPGWISVPDSNSMFMITIVDMKKFGLDSATLTPLLNQPEFYQQYRTSAQAKFGEATLVYDTSFLWNGLHVHEFRVKKAGTDANFPYQNITIRSVFIGAKIYAVSVLQKEITEADQKKFFESLQLN